MSAMHALGLVPDFVIDADGFNFMLRATQVSMCANVGLGAGLYTLWRSIAQNVIGGAGKNTGFEVPKKQSAAEMSAYVTMRHREILSPCPRLRARGAAIQNSTE